MLCRVALFLLALTSLLPTQVFLGEAIQVNTANFIMIANFGGYLIGTVICGVLSLAEKRYSSPTRRTLAFVIFIFAALGFFHVAKLGQRAWSGHAWLTVANAFLATALGSVLNMLVFQIATCMRELQFLSLVVLGTNVAGLFTGLARWAWPDGFAAIVALTIMLAATFFMLAMTTREYTSKIEPIVVFTIGPPPDSEEKINFCTAENVNLFLTFATTFFFFPSLQKFQWRADLVFNGAAFVGSLSPFLMKPNLKVLTIGNILRCLIVAAFRAAPPLPHQQLIDAATLVFWGLTFGVLFSQLFASAAARSSHSRHNKKITSTFSSASASFGSVVGSLLVFLLKELVLKK
jgi:hypothetical protein